MNNCSPSEMPADFLAEFDQRIEAQLRQFAIKAYRPYPKQMAFHEAGRTKRERLFRAGNQLGKTYSGAAEMAFHLTGDYPDWWPGRRWNRPVNAWVGGKDSLSVRDSVTKLLLGSPDDRGTGSIPGRSIVGIDRAAGIKDGIDSALIRHKSGRNSRLTFKSYDQGRERWQATTLDLVWLDEEPDLEIFTEALSRTNATGGMLYLTATPLLGMSDVVMRFLTDGNEDRADVNMTIAEAEHLTPEDRARIIRSYPEHEREARTNGAPMLGSGRIFPIAESAISCAGFPIPDYWAQIGGLDFGWDHPTAAAKLAWDRDADIVYVTAVHRLREATPIIHAAALKPWGATLPWSWPHDGLQHDKGSGETLAGQYRKHGLTMLRERATFQNGDSGVEAGLLEMLERMETGRFKVFNHLADFFDEFRLYHRQNGRIVKVRDDIISSVRYAMMMLRFARPAKAAPKLPPKWQGHHSLGSGFVGNGRWMRN